jgi:VWFA-related protein
MVVTYLRPAVFATLLLCPGLALPAFAYQADLNASSARLSPPRSRENVAREASNTERTLPEATLRMDTSLVLVPAQVTTREGAPIADLTRNDFRIYEDGSRQEISYFATDDAPISIGLLFDSSGSMKNKKKNSSQAAAAFFRTANVDDEFFLIEFDERPRLTVPFTKDIDLLSHEINHARPFGRTALYDAIQMALGVMKRAQHDRKALVIVSDGGDNRSRQTFGSIKSALREANVQLYSMDIFDPEGVTPSSPEETKGPEVLDQLAEVSGGRNFPIMNLENLATVSARIGKLLRNQYLLGYNPSNASRDGLYRGIKLDVVVPVDGTARVQYRKGYYAPQQ